MALVTSRTSLSQGASTSESVTFTASSGANTTITGTGLPVVALDDFFEIRSHPIAGNNGLYIATGTPTTSSVSCTKVSGADPTDDTAETATWLGDTTTYKSVMFDVATLEVYILEQGNVDAEGVTGQAMYSFMMQEWKDDDFLIANAPFPMLTIDSDAGKYIIGQDASGNNSGWNWADNTTHSVRTRKLLRNAGWDEIDSNGNTTARYVGVVTLGAFEDENNDTAYYQFGTDTTVDDTVDFTFAGPVNEPVQFFEEIGNPDSCNFATTATITRGTGSFVTDGYKVGGQVTIRNSTNNDGTYTLTAVAATTLTVSGTPFTTGTDSNAILAVDNDNAITLRLRVRDADTYGKTYSQANLASAGKTILGNFVYSFPLANASDLKIDATDATIIGSTPYVGTSEHSHTDGSVTVDDATFTDSTNSPFVAGDVGKLITITTGSNAGIYEIVTYTDASNVEVDRTFAATQSSISYDIRPYGMSITYYATGQSRSGLVGGSYNFGIIIDGNNGTNEEVYEYVAYQLRQSADIDADSDTAIGRTMDGLMRFVGDTLEVGSTDGGLTFPTNPDGGGTGVFIDNLNAASKNDVRFFDNTQPATPQRFPETIPITLDFNATLVGDTAAEYDLFYDRTIRTTETCSLTAGGVFTGTLPTNSEIVVGAYVRLAFATTTAADGVYQIETIDTPGSQWTLNRYDNGTITAVTSESTTIDQNCVDTPDAIIVHTDVVALGDSNISFTAPDTITSDGDPDFSVFTDGMKIQVVGSTSNDGIYEVDGNSTTTTITTIEQTISTEATQDPDISQVVSGLTSNDDFSFSYDFDGNTQGGRTVSTTTYVKAKAIGATTAQYTTSTVQTIASGTPLTIPLVSQTERNYV